MRSSSLREYTQGISKRGDSRAATCIHRSDGTPIYAIDPILDRRWAEFVEDHPGASVFHSREWLQSLSATYEFAPVAFVDAPPGEKICHGQVFCLVNSWLTGKRLVSLPFSDHAESLCGEDEMRAISSYLRAKVDSGDLRYVELRSGVHGGNEFGFETASEYYLHKIDIEDDLFSIYGRFHQNCIQRKIRRAEREGITYSEGAGDDYLNEFYRLFLQTHSRHHSPPPSPAWFRNLRNFMGHRIKVRVAWKGSVPIAAMITLAHNRTLMFKYGCSNATYHKFGGVALLFWKCIQDAKSVGMREFDLGRSAPDHRGLILFKEHLGAQRTAMNYLRYPARVVLGPHTWEYKLAESILSFVPSATLRAVGPLLYKHMA